MIKEGQIAILREKQQKYQKTKEQQKVVKEMYRKSIDDKRGNYQITLDQRAARTAEFTKMTKELEKIELEHLRTLQETMNKEILMKKEFKTFRTNNSQQRTRLAPLSTP